MRIVVRADASAEIGMGHIVRTRTLATVLRDRGADILFVCRPHCGNMIDALQADGFAVRYLPAADPSVEDGSYSGWVGATQTQDAMQTLDVLKGPNYDWVVVDHYGLGSQWQSVVRHRARRILVVDDLADREHDCDVLVDQNYALNPQGRYRGLVGEQCTCLLGPRYALLKPEYRRVRSTMPPRPRPVSRVLVFLGGGDTGPAMEQALAALSRPDLEHLEIDLVAGSTLDVSSLGAGTKRSGRITVYSNLPDLAQLMARADLAIGAGGSTTWERLCMGLPSIVMSIADNQTPACEALARDGFICYLGRSANVSVQDIAESVRALSGGSDGARQMSERGMAMVDGLGAARVAQAILTSEVRT